MGRGEEAVKPAQPDHGEVKRPDTKNAPHIKRWNEDGTGVALFAQQQLRNQIGAKKEKDADAKFPGAPDGPDLGGLVEVPYEAMGDKDQQKSQDPENIEARTVETVPSSGWSPAR